MRRLPKHCIPHQLALISSCRDTKNLSVISKYIRMVGPFPIDGWIITDQYFILLVGFYKNFWFSETTQERKKKTKWRQTLWSSFMWYKFSRLLFTWTTNYTQSPIVVPLLNDLHLTCSVRDRGQTFSDQLSLFVSLALSGRLIYNKIHPMFSL